jgi:transposase
MSHATLLPDPAEVRLDHLISESNAVTVVVQTAREAVPCPDCQHPSRRVHSHYTRTLADLPWNGIAVRLRLHTRRFFCSSLTCSRRVFTERLPSTAGRYARRTLRLDEALQILGLLVGGEPGARLAQKLGMRTSGDTLLRRTRQHTVAEPPTPRVLGVDDWAWKRGYRYGTVLVDLERHAVIDLLPDREAASLEQWLQQHSGVEVISRDRSNAYAEGASQGAPEAAQVADRWHLLRNVGEALQRVVEREAVHLAPAAEGAARSQTTAVEAPTWIEVPVSSTPLPVPRPLTRPQQMSEERRKRRQACYSEAMRLRGEGCTQNEIAQKLSLSTRTVRRWEQAGQFPERVVAPPRRTVLNRFLPHLEERWRQGVHNGRVLWRELQQQGYRGSRGTVQRWATRQLQPLTAAPRQTPMRIPRPREAAWWLQCEDSALTAEQRAFVRAFEQRCPAVADAAALAREFARLLRQRQAEQLTDWLDRAEGSVLRSLSTSLRRDEQAVRAAFVLPWSNGQTEGQVHRLKLLKRQTYGRAKFDLLKARVLYRAA